MKIIHSSESFGNLKPNDTFRPIIGDTAPGFVPRRGNLNIVIGDGGYPKGYDLEKRALVSYKEDRSRPSSSYRAARRPRELLMPTNKPITVQAFQTTDGKLHDDGVVAVEHQTELNIKQVISEWCHRHCYGNMSQVDVANEMWDNLSSLREALGGDY